MYIIRKICILKFGFCVLNVFARIAWLSKCDFWNLWKISDRYDIFSKKQYFFFEMKNFLEKIEKLFFSENFHFFNIKIDFYIENMKIFRKKKFSIFSRTFFISKKNIVFSKKISYRSEIFQRFQKSHLESHLMRANTFKMQKRF